MSVRIQLRRDTAANWASTNPTLTQGEPGYETDTGKIKYGDGSTAWNSLPYAALQPTGGVVTGDLTLNEQSELRFADADSSNWLGLQAPVTVASNVIWTLPSVDGGDGQFLSTNGTGTLSWASPEGGFPAGTAMLFVQTSAPTGWTKSTTHDDKVLRVVSGSAGSGGTTAFTSVFTSRTPTGTVGATTLTESQIPSHSHTGAVGGAVGLTAATGVIAANSLTRTTSSTGGGSSHNHSFTGTALDFDVQYVDVIIATKD